MKRHDNAYDVVVQVTHRNLDIAYLTLPYSGINAHCTASDVVDLYQFCNVHFGHFAVIVGRDTMVTQDVAGKRTYDFPTLVDTFTETVFSYFYC